MTEPPRRYDVTVTVDQDGGHHLNPAEFAVAARQASARTRLGRSSASSKF